ncbi:uncharacterized protein LOC127255914 [Andrographis paniculata]|uniref:uncharacterized protein LOC127255914 n=1 Tax=Andrographis paniculata TaxID=175694 RepID=UPI0021E93E48|nr:uncharacterized protein LOC127255914 [Andrographis paniculata]XP_051137646.1 uncharacterized protein LOC127255914 [Andrographis paniculata]
MQETDVPTFTPPAAGHGGGGTGTGTEYILPSNRCSSEDILFCIDVGPEMLVEMKVNVPNGRPYTRLDSIKQAIMLFVHAKLTINPDHRFAFTALAKSTYWLKKEFSSEVDSALAALRDISVDSSSTSADLTHLFKLANHEAKKSRSQNRIFRVILLYCRSSTIPQYQIPSATKLFTMDVMYLHDKPGPDNCPQKVYDSMVDALERVSEFEGYIFESGQGLTRSLFRHMCVLLSHPQQRCLQDDVDLPKPLTKKTPAAEATPGDNSNTVAASPR